MSPPRASGSSNRPYGFHSPGIGTLLWGPSRTLERPTPRTNDRYTPVCTVTSMEAIHDAGTPHAPDRRPLHAHLHRYFYGGHPLPQPSESLARTVVPRGLELVATSPMPGAGGAKTNINTSGSSGTSERRHPPRRLRSTPPKPRSTGPRSPSRLSGKPAPAPPTCQPSRVADPTWAAPRSQRRLVPAQRS